MAYVPPHKRQKLRQSNPPNRFPSNKPRNTSKQTKLQQQLRRKNGDSVNYLINTQNSKNKCDQRFPSQFHKRHHNGDINALKNCKSASDIMQFLQNKPDIGSISVYVKAIEKLIKSWGDCESVYLTIDMMKKRGIGVPLSVHCVLMKGLCMNDQLSKALSILKQLEREKVELNHMIFNTIISGCQKKGNQTGNVQIAETTWNKMIALNISPDITSYMVMISVYADARDVEKCEELFNEVIQQQHEMSKLGGICNNMLKLYGSCCDKEKLIDIHDFMTKNNIPLTIIEYTTLMRAYVKLEECDKVFKMFETIHSEMDAGTIIGGLDAPCIGMVGAACLKCIKLCYQKDPHAVEIDEYLSVLKETIPQQYPDLIDAQYKQVILRGVLWAYLNHWNSPTIDETLDCISDSFGYWNKDRNGMLALDLHGLSHIVSKFIVRRVFCYERNNFAEGDELYIVVGKAKHRRKCDIFTGTIRETIADELSRWTPSIKTYGERNPGRIVLDRSDVKHFLDIHQNIHPSSKLCFPRLIFETVQNVL
eukprot:152064_1